MQPVLRKAVSILGAALLAGTAMAGEDGVDVQPVGVIGDPGGSGPYPAVAVAVASMRDNTVYVPAKLPDEKLPVLLWGTGGCKDNGLGYSEFLREIASHGYFVVSGGHPRYERRQRDEGEQLDPAELEAMQKLPDTDVAQLVAAIDWLEQQTTDPDSDYHGHIDTAKIAAMGHSCGGLQAIALGADPRVDTVIAFNSGVLSEVPTHLPPNANLIVDKTILDKLHGPIAYIEGGPEDIAYENGLDDFRRLTHVPVLFAENGVGHGGTFWADDTGGDYARVAIAWMDWQLKGDASANDWFAGADCGLCTMPGWKVQKKGIDD